MEFYDFPETVGNVIIPTDFHPMIFQRGRAKNHQPDMEHPEWIAGILDGEITMDFRSRWWAGFFWASCVGDGPATGMSYQVMRIP